ncbi:MAG TPA: DNA topoisomerase VI subunit B [Nitrososphaeraceae archaeon]
MKQRTSTEITTQTKRTQAGALPNNGKVRYDRKAESEFFVDNSALAGFTGERILYMAVRELIENALDSCEVDHILPRISLSLKMYDSLNDMWIITCQDNGVGIPPDKVPVAVCSFLTSGKYVEKQQRGLFGVGLKMIAAFSTKDTDHPLKVWTKTLEGTDEFYFELRTDIGTNKPIVLSKDTKKYGNSFNSKSGFRIEAMLRARLSPITKSKIYDYISQSSIVNPYAIITFTTDEGSIVFERRTNKMPEPSSEVLPHPSDMDLKTLKRAILSFTNQKTTIQGILCNSFQKMSNEKAKEILSRAGVELKNATKYDEHELIKIVNACRQTKFQSPNTDHLSPVGEQILTAGMMEEYTIVTKRENNNVNETPNSQLSVRVLKPALTAYSSKTCIIVNRATIVECGIAYGGNINSFRLYRFANKIPLLYDEGSDVAREVVSEVEINKMGITKKDVKEQFFNPDVKSDRAIDLLPIHIFFHICSTKIPYKTAGKESIASEGSLKKYMRSCLSDLYKKVSAQIRKEIKIKEAENRLRLYKHYIPLIVDAISESINIDAKKLSDAFLKLVENRVGETELVPPDHMHMVKTNNVSESRQEVRESEKNLVNRLKLTDNRISGLIGKKARRVKE